MTGVDAGNGGARSHLEDVLRSPELADRVEMVVSAPAPDSYRAAAVDGEVTFVRSVDGDRYRYEVTGSYGRDPLGDQSTDRFVGHGAERDGSFPERTANAYPHAFDSIAQFFDAPHAPDLLAMHTAAHHVDGHLGQHGSLGAVQARAPFIAAGAGVRPLGRIHRATRVVNVAPTVARLLGVDEHPQGVGPTGRRRADALLRRQDGDVEIDILDGERAEHVVVFLLDGCNANLLHDAIDGGEAPNISDLARRGSTFGHGSMASLPTATLANHTTAITGSHPGHSGVLHNAWVDRSTGDAVDLLDLQQMFWAMQHLSGDVETLFDAVARSRPGAFTSASFEFCDTGADYSTFALVRSGARSTLPPEEELGVLDPDGAGSEKYRFMSRVDHLSLTHTLECWRQEHGNPLPTLSWCSLALTDEAGHESGPHGIAARAAVRDSDRRVGEVVAEVGAAGALDRTAFLVVADHGMEQSDPSVDRPWSEELAATGVAHRDVGGGLVYLE